MKREYKTVPFMANVKPGAKSQMVADQLQSVLQEVCDQGWEFVATEDVNVRINSGCLGSLLGQEPSYMRYDLIIFRKPFI